MSPRIIVILAIVALLVGIAGGCGTGSAARKAPSPQVTQKAALRSPPLQQYPPPAPQTEGSLFSDEAQPFLFTDVRANNVGDIVTINIVETSKASKQTQTNLGRNNEVQASLKALLGYETNLPGVGGDYSPSTAIDAKFGSKFTGNGKTTRNETMSAQISARVIQILPNGDLVLRGSREVTVNNEKQYLIIQGVVRPQDISPDNTVLSSYIADARIDYTGKGDLSDQQRQGWASRVLNVIWPF
jgi:flagellar L-ring protein precursor FlgH